MADVFCHGKINHRPSLDNEAVDSKDFDGEELAMFRLNDLELQVHMQRHQENVNKANRASRMTWTREIPTESTGSASGRVSSLIDRFAELVRQPIRSLPANT